MPYQHLLFDLDDTLWHFERNANETLTDLHRQYGLQAIESSLSVEAFLQAFHQVNRQLWQRYNVGQLDQETLRTRRFVLIFEALSIQIPEDICLQLAHEYVLIGPTKPHLIPGAKELLEELRPDYGLHIITNGFVDVQRVKMEASGIAHFFDTVVTSAEAGVKKPDKQIFEYTLNTAGAKAGDCLMIGDNWDTDIVGAATAGIDSVYFCPQPSPQTQHPRIIRQLAELKQYL
jgi:putative hydrolase of the HAD superfamily